MTVTTTTASRGKLPSKLSWVVESGSAQKGCFKYASHVDVSCLAGLGMLSYLTGQ